MCLFFGKCSCYPITVYRINRHILSLAILPLKFNLHIISSSIYQFLRSFQQLLKQGMMTCNLGTHKLRQGHHCGFEASLGYEMSSPSS